MINSRRILLAFLCGQAVQVFLQVLGNVMGVEKSVLWASAAGFLISFAVFMGMCVVGREFKESQHVRKRGKETV